VKNLSTLLRKLISQISLAWSIIGIVLLIIILLDVFSTPLVEALRYVKTNMDERLEGNPYKDTTWIKDYNKEFSRASKTDWRSYVYWRRTEFKGKYINIDNKGIRHTYSGSINSNDNVIKIYMFGGSTLWGTGARDDFTIPSLLAKELLNSGRSVQVKNFGETGYVSTQSLVELLLQLKQGNIPDVVIFYDGINDIFSGLQNHAAGIPQNEENRKKEFNLLKSRRYVDLRNSFFKETLYRSNIYLLLNQLRQKIFKISTKEINFIPDDSKNMESKIIESYVFNIKRVNQLSKEYGFKAIFYWQPVVFTKDYVTPYEKKKQESCLYCRDFFNKTYAQISRREPELRHYNFYNLSNIFAHYQQPLFIDCWHISEEGNRIIAHRIGKDVANLINSFPLSKDGDGRGQLLRGATQEYLAPGGSRQLLRSRGLPPGDFLPGPPYLIVGGQPVN
jgi:lysophospholipase L1-like esterase